MSKSVESAGRSGRSAVGLCALVFALAAGAPPARAQGCATFQEQNGLVVIEVEAAPLAGQWVAESLEAGFTGASYYRWNGPDLFSTPGQGVLSYQIAIQNPGTYTMALHNRHNHPDSSLENDVWLRIDGGSWFKCYSNNGASTVNVWNWHTRFEVGTSHLNPDIPLSAGLHTLQFSGRSRNFRIDRFHLALGNHPDAQNKNAPQSPCAGGNASTYCTAKVNSAGCTPHIVVAAGQPSASAGSGFIVAAADLINGQLGLFIFGSAPAGAPFHGGTLCVAPPITRTLPASTGGNGFPGSNCSGRLALDFNALIFQAPDPALAPGAQVYGQFWYRDPGIAGTIGLSNGVHMTIQP